MHKFVGVLDKYGKSGKPSPAFIIEFHGLNVDYYFPWEPEGRRCWSSHGGFKKWYEKLVWVDDRD